MFSFFFKREISVVVLQKNSFLLCMISFLEVKNYSFQLQFESLVYVLSEIFHE